MRIVSWNVQSLTAEPEKIVAAVLDEEPSLIALQEYPSGPNAAAAEVIFTVNGFVPFTRPAKARPFRTIVFAPQGAQLSASPPNLAENDPFWVDVQLGGLGVSAAHIAIPKYAALREMHWQVALSLVSSKLDTAHILIGDLNTTRHGIDQVGDSISGDQYLRDLETAGWTEAWRMTHPEPAPREYSWYHRLGSGFRFDQAWLSPTLAPRLIGAHMIHDVRERGLSDHSMLVVEVDV